MLETDYEGEFDELLRTGDLVDKTEFINEFLSDSDKVYVVSRPRQIGKSVNVDMLRQFLDRKLDFSRYQNYNLEIMSDKYKALRATHMNKHPVIHIDFSTAADSTMEKTWNMYVKKIVELFRRFSYLENAANITDDDRRLFMDIKHKHATDAEYKTSVFDLTRMLRAYHGQRCVILFDEVDAPMAAGRIHGYYDDISMSYNNVFRSSLRGNIHVMKALVISVVPLFDTPPFANMQVRKCSLRDDRFQTQFGFLREEVEELKSRKNLANVNITDLALWYNQLKVGSTKIFNPYAITECLKNKGKLQIYSEFTGSLYQVADAMFKAGGLLPLLDFQVLLKDGSLNRTIDPLFNFRNVFSDIGNLYAFLYHIGFVTEDTLPSNKKSDLVTRVKIAGRELEKIIKKRYIKPAIANGHLPDYELFTKRVHEKNIDAVTTMLEEYVVSAEPYLINPQFGNKVSINKLREYMKTAFQHYTVMYDVDFKIIVKGNFMVLTFKEKKETFWSRLRAGTLTVSLAVLSGNSTDSKGSIVAIGQSWVNLLVSAKSLFG